MANRPIHWDAIAVKQLGIAIEYIARDSIQNAEKVWFEVIQRIEMLSSNPESFPPDKYKLDNNENEYRVFELYHLRISYFVGVHE